MPSEKSKIKILLVEDERSIADMYKMKFEREGFEVIYIDNGDGVLKTVLEKKPNIVLLDIILPKVDGFSVLKELKNNSKTKMTPIIMLTNLGQEEDINKAKKLGVDEYLVKANLTPTQVVEKVKEILKIK
ncbi:MAG: response regulator [Patescibacteria group bacterium]